MQVTVFQSFPLLLHKSISQVFFFLSQSLSVFFKDQKYLKKIDAITFKIPIEKWNFKQL